MASKTNRMQSNYTISKGLMLLTIALIPFLISCRSTQVFHDNYQIKGEKEQRIFALSKQLKETSGLLKIDDYFLSFNDSGGKNTLFAFKENDSGDMKEIYIPGTENIDWEDICMDDNYLYIADIGNNFGSRDTLTIYRIRKDELFSEIKEVSEIRYRYTEKSRDYFNCWKNPFDCEACIVKDDSIWLFSKNWQDESSRIYTIPTKPGFYEISETDKIEPKMLVTGATFHKDSSKLWLIGYHNFYPVLIRYNWEKSGLEAEQKYILKNRRGLQTEAIYIDDNENIFFTNERSIRRASLWKFGERQ